MTFSSFFQAIDQVNPHIITIATLTGHAVVAMGHAYSVSITPPILTMQSEGELTTPVAGIFSHDIIPYM